MPEKKSVLIRISPELWEELRKMASQDFRSINGEIEYLLQDAVRKRGRKVPTEPEDKRTR
jgi:hypothetical protein